MSAAAMKTSSSSVPSGILKSLMTVFCVLLALEMTGSHWTDAAAPQLKLPITKLCPHASPFCLKYGGTFRNFLRRGKKDGAAVEPLLNVHVLEREDLCRNYDCINNVDCYFWKKTCIDRRSWIEAVFAAKQYQSRAAF